MRFIVIGVGAIGGVLAGKLVQAGIEVIGVARGAQLEAIQERGLTLQTRLGDFHVDLDVVSSPSEIEFKSDDVILLCVKSQHTEFALQQLRNAGVYEQPIVCVQNGVANEDMALRYFPNVYGICVMLPAVFLEAGMIVAFMGPKLGVLDCGRYPSGVDEPITRIADILTAADFLCTTDPDVMRLKYGKLLMNLGNSPQAVLGPMDRNSAVNRAVRSEGIAVLKAAGIDYEEVGPTSSRIASHVSSGPVHGVTSPGGSSWQSLARGADSIEADFLNGEIVRLGRLHGVPTPVNAYFARLAHQMISEKRPAGSFPLSEVVKALRGHLED